MCIWLNGQLVGRCVLARTPAHVLARAGMRTCNRSAACVCDARRNRLRPVCPHAAMAGRYHGRLGPQRQFYLPDGIVQDGDNELALEAYGSPK